ncbi:hypothetical protein [Poseidonibacter ostreae]|uniref:Uncharacterized protein n=1 Tax=Poseidonibacter ostreae TaxID=2654171 RepID=A0A6L4WZN9_9BACT|nr:hypothetical protein [Poseidonibacter ostreae]KAB7891454.1 hypothetical protein GBG19_01035 [Poseidonibacter ostreae]
MNTEVEKIEKKINITGSFCSLEDTKEYRLINVEKCNKSLEDEISFYIYTVRKKYGKTERECHGNSFFINLSPRVENEFFGWLGNCMSLENGFTSYNDIKCPIFKTSHEVEAWLYEQRLNKLREASFGFLARKEFYYTPNYLLNKDGKIDIDYMADLLIKDGYGSHFKNNRDIARTICKEYLSKDIIDYKGQNEYILKEVA